MNTKVKVNVHLNHYNFSLINSQVFTPNTQGVCVSIFTIALAYCIFHHHELSTSTPNSSSLLSEAEENNHLYLLRHHEPHVNHVFKQFQ